VPAHTLSLSEGYPRFSVFWRIQHLLWALSFLVLQVTGFALWFSGAAWADAVTALCGGGEGRMLVHRMAAGVFIAVAVVHVAAFGWNPKRWRGIWLFKEDWLDMGRYLRYLLGHRPSPPPMGRYTCYQKIEYWETVLGGTIMISTGLIMGPGLEWALAQLPPRTLLYAQVFHLAEAALGLAVVVVWHLYRTVLRPKVFPMDWSWLTGRIDGETLAYDHARYWAQLQAEKSQEGDRTAKPE